MVACWRLFSVVVMSCTLLGCGEIPDSLDFSGGPETSSVVRPPASPSSAQTMYAAVDRLAVHQGPSPESPVAGRLALHQAVTRSGLEHGWAFVRYGTGEAAEGWVDGGKLLARLPSSAPAVASPAAPVPTPTLAPPEPPDAITEAANDPAEPPRAIAPPIEPVSAPVARPSVASPSGAPPSLGSRPSPAEPEMIDPF